jgi:uncharacterized caspase-like protein
MAKRQAKDKDSKVGWVGSIVRPILTMIISTALVYGSSATGDIPVPHNESAVAVVIGVSDYANDIPPVDYALYDANAIRRFLIEGRGYLPGNIIFVEDPTKAELESIFGIRGNPQGKLHNYVRPGKSEVFVYYSGHGATDPEQKTAYLIPADADPQLLSLTAYPLNLLKTNLAEVPARQMTLVIESCFSGSSEAGPVVKGISPISVVPTASLGELRNGILLASAQGDQVSSWYRPMGHSLFTYFLLKALYGAADEDGDGAVSLGETSIYLGEEVSYWARRSGRKQEPYIAGGTKAQVLSTPTASMRAWLKRQEKRESTLAMDLVSPTSPSTLTPQLRLPQGSGSLYVDSEPRGSRVFLDAEDVGSTPLELERVPQGERTLTIVQPGYVSLTKVVSVESGVREIVREMLAQQTGALRIEVNVPGASVFVDGRHRGESPQVLGSMAVGTYDVRLEHPDYETWQGSASIDYGQETVLAYNLTPKPGTLLVLAVPGGELRIDGNSQGTTPWNGQVPAGVHQLLVYRSGYRVGKKNITVEPNRPMTVEFTLERDTGQPKVRPRRFPANSNRESK